MASELKAEDQSESTYPVPLAGQLAVVVLTAGRGSRMRSSTPKVLHPIAGLPMIEHVVQAVGSLRPRQTILVVGPTSKSLKEQYDGRVDFAWQQEPLGTGHAVLMALPHLAEDVRWVLVSFGDHPLTDGETLSRVCEEAERSQALVTLLGVELDDPGSYGRFRWEEGKVTGIVEAREDQTVYSGPVTINSGICCFRRAWLEEQLPHVQPGASGEIYMTSLVEVAAASKHPDPVAWVLGKPDAAFGINNRVELAEAERIIRNRILRQHMLNGVAVVAPESTYIEAGVEIGQDTRIEPGSIIRTGTTIGENCIIGPYSVIEHSTIGNGVRIINSTIEHSEIGDGSDVGPYAHLRPGTVVSPGVHIGNYVEMKNTTVGSGTAVGHFSYLGDAEVGENVNVGAGTITCNYDGVQKNRTVVGANVFLGSDTLLIPPIEVGDGARTGAGSVVNKDVPAGATVVGVPARLIRKKAQE
jgi:bifunctional UDP-N-acetylglucosamine pyrophosphorylase/glucosamine-1-phosphate N-acetyltransferase